jgi:mono/diheme cytochrome c family protein
MTMKALILAAFALFFTAAHAQDTTARLARGRYLAGAGDCVSCHTAKGGEPFAGGRIMATPFGSIPTPNITPDPVTGIGRWTADDFYGAMHDGISRDGSLLYPAFPFTSYTKMTRYDVDAVFAYLRTVAPVVQANLAPRLDFPYRYRPLMAAWRALYFDVGEYIADPNQSAAWNRGAYLVQGAGHCNDCHTARNALGATVSAPRLGGALIPMQNWYAPDLGTKAGGGLAGFRTKDIVDLLKTGRSARGTAFGPMAEVVQMSTQHLADGDLAAIATYLQSLPAREAVPPPDPVEPSRALKGQAIYADRCARCHGDGGQGNDPAYPPLDGNSSVMEPTGVNAIRMVLSGGFAPVTAGNPRPYSMPPFAQVLGDEDVAAVVTYIRQAWGNRAGAVSATDVRAYRGTPAR